jgi:hypothetical protein
MSAVERRFYAKGMLNVFGMFDDQRFDGREGCVDDAPVSEGSGEAKK